MATQDQTPIDTIAIDSDALRANLLETATDEVTIDPSLLVLEEIVKNYKGISKNLHELLYEVCHPISQLENAGSQDACLCPEKHQSLFQT